MRRLGFRVPPLAPDFHGGVVQWLRPLACNQQMGVRIPPLPPFRRGCRRPTAMPLAPSVAVAEWIGGGLWNRPRGFNFLRPPQRFFRPIVQQDRAQPSEGWDSGSNPDGPAKCIYDFSGMRKTAIRCVRTAETLGSIPRFPTKVFRGSQAGKAPHC